MTDYNNLNKSELVALARERQYYGAHIGLEREILIDMIEGKVDDDFPPDPIDTEREAMMEMMEQWPSVKSQLKCSDEYYACWNCPAGRAHICAIKECEKNILAHVRDEQKVPK